YLFKADGSGVYLSLSAGIGDKDFCQTANWLRDKVPDLYKWGQDDINLVANQENSTKAQQANIIARYYPGDQLPKEAVLQQDLQELLALYQQARDYSVRKVRTTVSNDDVESVDLPKPFILLAGLSGTGKTRFVREQAQLSGSLTQTYALVSVRPDWHDPSDLLGYVSRLGKEAEYVVTDVLRFIVSAWQEIADNGLTFDKGKLGWGEAEPFDGVRPYWLCLDEMNLAPVEQYFADYLSVLETRHWASADELAQGAPVYQCEALLKPLIFNQLNARSTIKLRETLNLNQPKYESLWLYFIQNGISLPFNLIVAGTVNMDETTHGFSRKVIDRALTLDFGSFFPSRFKDFFDPTYKSKSLDFPKLSQIKKTDLSKIKADPDGAKSIDFLICVNRVLHQTPFELAYRPLNELLISVVCFEPEDDYELQAVWDDFLMCKVLPRISGDLETLSVSSNEMMPGDSLLTALENCLEGLLSLIWNRQRIELLLAYENTTEAPKTDCRSKAKLAWMKKQLTHNRFTSFWP
ncbi:MAG: DUF3578 domain-containing protein, partial [Algicola sp.]|nr:DUF3578 domain-containing protein [Algicola sp.]